MSGHQPLFRGPLPVGAVTALPLPVQESLAHCGNTGWWQHGQHVEQLGEQALGRRRAYGAALERQVSSLQQLALAAHAAEAREPSSSTVAAGFNIGSCATGSCSNQMFQRSPLRSQRWEEQLGVCPLFSSNVSVLGGAPHAQISEQAPSQSSRSVPGMSKWEQRQQEFQQELFHRQQILEARMSMQVALFHRPVSSRV
eukprot:TRINITY_DN52115_c0_g1_i1.p1 TRINITY_DN52115_c0_g1~~TRINITY_DN52115_c0_g1_i1.p1  ORF type:complete len:198 (+),score=43.11 TRINITY_DN52115_c0_g1_i1:27-620(+)